MPGGEGREERGELLGGHGEGAPLPAVRVFFGVLYAGPSCGMADGPRERELSCGGLAQHVRSDLTKMPTVVYVNVAAISAILRIESSGPG
ncbi:MAG TPA: hypothetical protein VFO16_00295 [Pseudonocardiaceae bacterium]|nr:hypothetical protein [Pseudonocardiaceae bacterium]